MNLILLSKIRLYLKRNLRVNEPQIESGGPTMEPITSRPNFTFIHHGPSGRQPHTNACRIDIFLIFLLLRSLLTLLYTSLKPYRKENVLPCKVSTRAICSACGIRQTVGHQLTQSWLQTCRLCGWINQSTIDGESACLLALYIVRSRSYLSKVLNINQRVISSWFVQNVAGVFWIRWQRSKTVR
jgi:hypothetical protein